MSMQTKSNDVVDDVVDSSPTWNINVTYNINILLLPARVHLPYFFPISLTIVAMSRNGLEFLLGP